MWLLLSKIARISIFDGGSEMEFDRGTVMETRLSPCPRTGLTPYLPGKGSQHKILGRGHPEDGQPQGRPIQSVPTPQPFQCGEQHQGDRQDGPPWPTPCIRLVLCLRLPSPGPPPARPSVHLRPHVLPGGLTQRVRGHSVLKGGGLSEVAILGKPMLESAHWG